jgi:(p)ppGpp synthase/HD superfamily hydrolase
MINKVKIDLLTTDDEWVFRKIIAVFSKNKLMIRNFSMSSNQKEDLQEYFIVIESTAEIQKNILNQLQKQIGILNATMEILSSDYMDSDEKFNH